MLNGLLVGVVCGVGDVVGVGVVGVFWLFFLFLLCVVLFGFVGGLVDVVLDVGLLVSVVCWCFVVVSLVVMWCCSLLNGVDDFVVVFCNCLLSFVCFSV